MSQDGFHISCIISQSLHWTQMFKEEEVSLNHKRKPATASAAVCI